MNSDGRRVLWVFKVLMLGIKAKILSVLSGGAFPFAGGGVRTLRTVMPWEDQEDGEDAPQGSPVASSFMDLSAQIREIRGKTVFLTADHAD